MEDYFHNQIVDKAAFPSFIVGMSTITGYSLKIGCPEWCHGNNKNSFLFFLTDIDHWSITIFKLSQIKREGGGSGSLE